MAAVEPCSSIVYSATQHMAQLSLEPSEQPLAIEKANTAAVHICGNGKCGKTALQMCGRCESVRYCSRECQLAAHKTHKQGCSFLRVPAPEGDIGWQFMEADGSVHSMTQEEFLKLTGDRAKFKTEPYATKESVRHFRTHPQHLSALEQKAGHNIKNEDPRVAEFEKKPPILYLTQEGQLGLGVRAGQKIKKWSIVCLFGGEIRPDAPKNFKNFTYQVAGGEDHTDYTSKGVFVNFGAPNVAITLIVNYKNEINVSCLVALRDIERGEFLHTNYASNHGILQTKYIVDDQSYKQAEDFARDHFYTALDLIASRKVDNEELVLEMFRYIINTSNLFFLLHLRQILSVQKTRELLSKNNTKKFFINNEPIYMHCYNKALDTIDKVIKQGAPAVNAVINLAQDMTARAYSCVLQAVIDDQNIAANITAYKTFGQILDQTYLYTHKTPYGHRDYWEKDEKLLPKSTIPNVVLDSDEIVTRKPLLTPFLLTTLKGEIRHISTIASKQGWKEESLKLYTLYQML